MQCWSVFGMQEGGYVVGEEGECVLMTYRQKIDVGEPGVVMLSILIMPGDVGGDSRTLKGISGSMRSAGVDSQSNRSMLL